MNKKNESAPITYTVHDDGEAFNIYRTGTKQAIVCVPYEVIPGDGSPPKEEASEIVKQVVEGLSHSPALAQLQAEKWDMDSLHRVYYASAGPAAGPLIDFVVTEVLSALNKALGDHGWNAYESDGGLDDAISYEINSILERAGVLEDRDRLMFLWSLCTDEHGWGYEMRYDNTHDFATLLTKGYPDAPDGPIRSTINVAIDIQSTEEDTEDLAGRTIRALVDKARDVLAKRGEA